MEEVIGMQYYNCAKRLIAEFPTLKNKEEKIIKIIEPMFEKYKKICTTMSQAKIPAIIIKGDDSILPTVFERINSKGSQLTKWQIYAATWSDNKIKVNKSLNKIIQFNLDRYKTMESENEINFDESDPLKDVENGILNIFELIFGFGKMITEEFPQLFGSNKNPTDVNSIGFNLVNACLVLRNNQIENLNKNLFSIIGDRNEINNFLLQIISCIKIVDKVLTRTTKFKSNLRGDSSPLHTEMQICSMIASVFINKHVTYLINENDEIIHRDIKLQGINDSWKQYKEQFELNALKTYLIDIIQTNWRGSGDKKLNHILINKEYYTREKSKEEFISTLNTWYENMKSEKKEYKKIAGPKEAEKVILNIIYSEQFKAIDQYDDSTYDIEHLATKEIMRKQLERFNGNLRLQISSIGNLCLLPEDYNRAKGGKTIYQYNNSEYPIEEIETKFSFTKEEDLKWTDNINLSAEELEKSYINFIDKRFEIIKDKLINILYENKTYNNFIKY